MYEEKKEIFFSKKSVVGNKKVYIIYFVLQNYVRCHAMRVCARGRNIERPNTQQRLVANVEHASATTRGRRSVCIIFMGCGCVTR